MLKNFGEDIFWKNLTRKTEKKTVYSIERHFREVGSEDRR
jgi:hypothetical protein